MVSSVYGNRKQSHYDNTYPTLINVGKNQDQEDA